MVAGAGASLTLTPHLLRALQRRQSGSLIERVIPSSGEKIPAVGLSFSNHAGCADHAALKEVARAFFDNGGRVFDALHVSADSEQFHIDVATQLGIEKKLFWSMRGTPPGAGGPPQPGPATARAHVESLLTRLKVPKIDLVMVNPQGDRAHIGALKEMKKEGLIRYIGVQTIGDPGYPATEAVMRSEPIDFIGVDYDIGNRARVEDTILPLALERKIAVMAFFPFGNAGGLSCTGGTSLFSRVANKPVPEWAAEFDAKSWAQFFTKYVISHPAVTVARVGTTKPHHMLDNIAGGIGRLPDEATRKRMAAFIDALPPAAPLAAQAPGAAPVMVSASILERYVGEYRTAAGMVLIIRRYGTMLVARPGSNPETTMLARSETRFSMGPTVVEFQLDGAGTVTGLVVEQGGQKTLASRTR